MEAWIKNQCTFNYRSQSVKLSATLKGLFTGKKVLKNEVDPFLINEDGVKDQQLKESDKKDDGEEKPEKIWRRLSLRSFRKRREKRQENKSKPRIPAVLSTYDKRTKEQESNNSNGWL